jgi:DNA-binding transcriptional regulator YhcF (GntR family)
MEDAVSPFERSCSQRINELLEFCTTCRDAEFRNDIFFANLETAVAVVGLKQFLKLTGCGRSVLGGWRRLRQRLQLPSLLRLSYHFGLPIHQWLTSHIPSRAFMDFHCQYPVGPVLKLRRTKLSHDEIRRALTGALQTSVANAPSMRQVAKDLGVSMCLIQTHFQDLADRISGRHRQSIVLRKEQSVQERVRIVRETVATMESEHCPVSVHRVVEGLRKAGVKGSWGMWNIAVNELRGATSSVPAPRKRDRT